MKKNLQDPHYFKHLMDHQFGELKKETNKFIKDTRVEALEMIRANNMTMLEMCKTIREYEKTIKHILDTCQNVEETLCNVLLAIRQNEYLQAWYPAQNGQPEQKVVGKYAKMKKSA